MRDFFHNYDPIFFISHIDGDCLNSKEGRLEGDALYITAKVKAADNAAVTINGKVYPKVEVKAIPGIIEELRGKAGV